MDKAGGDNYDGSEHVFSIVLPWLYPEFQEQEGLSFQMGMELHTFHPYNKLQIKWLWPHVKMIGQEQFGKQSRPPERVQRIDGTQHDIPSSVTFHHFTIEPVEEHLNEWPTLFFVTRLEGKSIFRAGCIDMNLRRGLGQNGSNGSGQAHLLLSEGKFGWRESEWRENIQNIREGETAGSGRKLSGGCCLYIPVLTRRRLSMFMYI